MAESKKPNENSMMVFVERVCYYLWPKPTPESEAVTVLGQTPNIIPNNEKEVSSTLNGASIQSCGDEASKSIPTTTKSAKSLLVQKQSDHSIREESTSSTLSEMAKSLASKLADKFTCVKIKKTDLDAAEETLRGELIESWEEKMEYDLTQGIPLENLAEFIEALKEALDLDEKVCTMLKTMKFATDKDKYLYEVNYKDDFEQKCGYFAMVKDSNSNTISCVYAYHVLKFKLAKKREMTKIEKKVFFIPIGNEVKIEERDVKLGTNDMEAIKGSYMRYKALEALRNEGIIQTIEFEN